QGGGRQGARLRRRLLLARDRDRRPPPAGGQALRPHAGVRRAARAYRGRPLDEPLPRRGRSRRARAGGVRMIARTQVRVIDLAQTLSGDTPVWPGMERLGAETSETYDQGGAFARVVTFGEHTGTHLDAPAHFHAGGLTVEGIPAADLVCEAVVIDIREACAGDPDYTLGVADVLAHERAHGPVPAHSAVLVCTGWSA